MRKTSLFVTLMCVLISTLALAAGGDMGGTDPNGSVEYPYLIEDLADFDTFASDPNYWATGVHTKLMTDIDLSDRTYTTAVIAPDTDSTNSHRIFDGMPFAAVFDGKGHVISNLVIDSADATNYYLGMFGQINGSNAKVKDLGIVDCSISGDDSYYLGGLCGRNSGTITDCYAIDAIVGGNSSWFLGGLCGENDSGIIADCYAIGAVNGEDDSRYLGGLCGDNNGNIRNCYAGGMVNGGDGLLQLGGLCGQNYQGTITDCYANGAVNGGEFSNDLGGLCGRNDEGTVNNSYAIGAVTGGDYSRFLGGLCGCNTYSSTINNCYAMGAVTGKESSNYLGGLCGENFGSTIGNSYATGAVTGGGYSNNLGGLCGYQDDHWTPTEISNCFWDTETSGMSVGYNLNPSYPGTITNVVGKTTANMQTQSTFTDWDFSDGDGDPPDWMMLREGEDYPRLAWQEVFAGDIAGLYGADMVDFAYLANYWGLDCDNPECDRADIDTSGDVGLGDLAAVANDWLK